MIYATRVPKGTKVKRYWQVKYQVEFIGCGSLEVSSVARKTKRFWVQVCVTHILFL